MNRLNYGTDSNTGGNYQRRYTVLIIVVTVLLCGILHLGVAQEKSTENDGYRIDQPGTITFTVGVKISGKVEKPQVMIFLPKEKTLFREEVLTRSFLKELSEPLPFSPIIE